MPIIQAAGASGAPVAYDSDPLANAFSSIGGLFSIGDYRRLWSIGAGVGIARWLELIALSIFTWQLTQSPSHVAAIAIVRMLPYALFGFVVGSFADIADRRRLLVGVFVLALATSAGMVVLALSGHAAYWSVLAVSGILGFVWTTDMPIRRRLLVEAAGGERIASALGLDNSTQHATRALGPLISGAAYQLVGVAGIFALICLVYAACIVWALALSRPPAAKENAGWPSIASLLDLPWELLRERKFQIVLGVTIVFNLWCFPLVGMIPVFAQRDLALGPAAVGALAACEGLGGVIGALGVGWVGSVATLFRFYYFGVLGFIATMAVLSLHLSLGSAVPLLLVLGVSGACFSATQFALVYSMADPARRGRATGFLSIFIGLSTVGYFMTGMLFDRFPSTMAMRIMAAAGFLGMIGLGCLWWRSARRLSPAATSQTPRT